MADDNRLLLNEHIRAEHDLGTYPHSQEKLERWHDQLRTYLSGPYKIGDTSRYVNVQYNHSNPTLDAFPNELLMKIFGYLSLGTLFRMEQVNRRFQAIMHATVQKKHIENLINETHSIEDWIIDKLHPNIPNILKILAIAGVSFKKLKVNISGGDIASSPDLAKLISRFCPNLEELHISTQKGKDCIDFDDLGLSLPNIKVFTLKVSKTAMECNTSDIILLILRWKYLEYVHISFYNSPFFRVDLKLRSSVMMNPQNGNNQLNDRSSNNISLNNYEILHNPIYFRTNYLVTLDEFCRLHNVDSNALRRLDLNSLRKIKKFNFEAKRYHLPTFLNGMKLQDLHLKASICFCNISMPVNISALRKVTFCDLMFHPVLLYTNCSRQVSAGATLSYMALPSLSHLLHTATSSRHDPFVRYVRNLNENDKITLPEIIIEEKNLEMLKRLAGDRNIPLIVLAEISFDSLHRLNDLYKKNTIIIVYDANDQLYKEYLKLDGVQKSIRMRKDEIELSFSFNFFRVVMTKIKMESHYFHISYLVYKSCYILEFYPITPRLLSPPQIAQSS